MKIAVDTDRMRSACAGIRYLTETLHSNMDSIEYLVTEMNGDWQGDAARAYAGKIVYVRREFAEMERFFEEYATLLDRFVSEYQRQEEELTAKIRNV